MTAEAVTPDAIMVPEVEKLGPVFCAACNKNTWPYQKPAEGKDGDGNSPHGMMAMVDCCSACHSVLGKHGPKATAVAPLEREPLPLAGAVPTVGVSPTEVNAAPPRIAPGHLPGSFTEQARARMRQIIDERAKLKREFRALREIVGSI